MSTPDPLLAIEAYGADLEVLEEYNCIPIRTHVVRDLLQVCTESGIRALKKVSHRSVRVEWSFLCAEYVAQSGFPNVPRFIRTRYGDPYVLHPTGTYYMTAWWPGRELDGQKTIEMFDGMQILGEWHEAAFRCRPQGIEVPRRVSLLERLRQAAETLQRYREISQKSQAPTPFEQLFVANAQDLLEHLRGTLQRLEDVDFITAYEAARGEGWVCHGDYTRHNVTLDGTAFTVWNYDKVHPGLPFMDTALYLHRYMPAYAWDPSVLAAALERYRETSSYPGNGRILAALLAVPLRSMQVVSWYFQRSRDWGEEEFVNVLQSSLDMDVLRMFSVQKVLEDPSEIHVATMPDSALNQTVPVLAQDEQSRSGFSDKTSAGDSRSGDSIRTRPKGPVSLRAKNKPAKRRMPSSASGHRPKLWGDVRPTDERE